MNELAQQLGYLGYYNVYPYKIFIGFVSKITALNDGTSTLYAEWAYSDETLI